MLWEICKSLTMAYFSGEVWDPVGFAQYFPTLMKVFSCRHRAFRQSSVGFKASSVVDRCVAFSLLSAAPGVSNGAILATFTSLQGHVGQGGRGL